MSDRISYTRRYLLAIPAIKIGALACSDHAHEEITSDEPYCRIGPASLDLYKSLNNDQRCLLLLYYVGALIDKSLYLDLSMVIIHQLFFLVSSKTNV